MSKGRQLFGKDQTPDNSLLITGISANGSNYLAREENNNKTYTKLRSKVVDTETRRTLEDKGDKGERKYYIG